MTLNLGVCWLIEFVSAVQQCYHMPTHVDKESQLVVDPLCRLQPVLLKEWQ